MKIEEKEYKFLHDWLLVSEHKPSYGFVDAALKSNKQIDKNVNFQEAFGFVLFIFESEFIRRNCSNEEVWSSLSHVFKGSCCENLFNSLGHATQKHKALIKDTVIKFNLRNSFNISGDTQDWFNTFFLQMGFPMRGLKNLPIWLYNINLTYSIQQLLNKNNSNYSKSFEELFETLKYIKSVGECDTDSLTKLESSSWIDKEWIPEILQTLNKNSNVDLQRSILTKIRLCCEKEPVFLVEVSFTDRSIEEQKVFIECMDEKHCYLKDSSGDYNDRQNSNTFKIPFSKASEIIDINVSNEHGVIVSNKELELWSDEEVTLFDNKGLQIPDEQDSLKSYNLIYAITPNDLRVEPKTNYTKGQEFNLYTLVNLREDTYNFYFDDCLMWSSNSLQSSSPYQEAKKNIRGIELKDRSLTKKIISLLKLSILTRSSLKILTMREMELALIRRLKLRQEAKVLSSPKGQAKSQLSLVVSLKI